MIMANLCNICTRKIQSHAKTVTCVICKYSFHCNCISINSTEIISILMINDWYCMHCLAESLPFLNISDDLEFHQALNWKDHFEINWNSVNDKIFDPFRSHEDDYERFPTDFIDPDDNYFNEITNSCAISCKYYLQDDFNKQVSYYDMNSKNTFSVSHLNTRSLQHNFTALNTYVNSLDVQFTVIGVTETWNTDSNFNLFNLQSYNFVEKHRSQRIGGGIGLYIRENLEYSERNDLNVFNDIVECLFIEVTIIFNNLPKNIVIGVVYRPPGQDINQFIELFHDILHKIKTERKSCYLMGDWNLNLLNYETHSNTANAIDMIYSYGFVPLIDRPTRITNESATIIDNIFTNEHFFVTKSLNGICLTDISDHFPIFHLSNIILNDTEDKVIIKRSFTSRNKQAFLNEISNTNWSRVCALQNAQDAFTKFHEVYLRIFENNFPMKKITYKSCNAKSWLSDSLKKCIKHKNHLYYKSLKVKTAYNELMYTTYRNKLKKILMKEEKRYYSNLLNANKSNMKKTWSIIKQIINKKRFSKTQSQFKLNDGTLLTDKSAISEKFNDFFINIGPTLANKIPDQIRVPGYYLGNPLPNSIFLEPVTTKELDEIIQNLKKSAAGYDELNKDILVFSIPVIQSTLLELLNKSLIQGVFPDELKIANITPIFKADDSSKFNNYRPVSVLPILSKIFERAMYNRLVTFLEAHLILYNKQFGFRGKHSTYMALMLLTDKLIKCMENGEIVIGVFLDFSKAFDTVDHTILLKKLYHYGIRGVAYHWFESYLNNRKQYVTYNGVKSTMKTIRCGVPQGSILGPLLFLIYINDLANVCKQTVPFLFADDTNLFKNGNDINSIVESLNSELSDISLWLKINKLSLNIKKTHYMIFTTKRKIIEFLDIKIDGTNIERVDDTKFLGVYIDEKLNWKKHISYLSGKVSRGMGILVKARKLITPDALKTLYFSFIYPFFTYCNHVWGKTSATSLNRLVILQKRCIRILTSSKCYEHTEPLFDKLGLLKFHDINKYLYARFMYRWYHADLPSIFHDIFVRVDNVHHYSTRQNSHLYCTEAKTELGKTKLTYQGPFIWNKVLKAKINPDTSEAVFTKMVKRSIKFGLI